VRALREQVDAQFARLSARDSIKVQGAGGDEGTARDQPAQ
jgi:hypothetical protein